MTAQENPVASPRRVRTGGAAADVWLNLAWPGLAQLSHGRRVAAACLAAEAVALVVLFVALPDWRILTFVGITVLTALSILDAIGTRDAD